MSRIGAAFLTAVALVSAASAVVPPASAAEVAPHRIAREAAWGCRDKADIVNLLFLGLSTSFDTALANALADGRCVYFTPGESVTIVEPTASGLVRVQRPGAAPAVYWTPARNLN